MDRNGEQIVNKEHKIGVVTLLALALPILSWGSAFPSIRYALTGYSPIQIATLRFIIGSLLLMVPMLC